MFPDRSSPSASHFFLSHTAAPDVDLYRELATSTATPACPISPRRSNPPDLATSVNNLANRLAEASAYSEDVARTGRLVVSIAESTDTDGADSTAAEDTT